MVKRSLATTFRDPLGGDGEGSRHPVGQISVFETPLVGCLVRITLVNELACIMIWASYWGQVTHREKMCDGSQGDYNMELVSQKVPTSV